MSGLDPSQQIFFKSKSVLQLVAQCFTHYISEVILRLSKLLKVSISLMNMRNKRHSLKNPF